MELKLSQSSSLPTPVFNSSANNHFNLLSQRWAKVDIQRVSWKGHYMSNKLLVHVVKKGETLSSISKMYEVPIIEIAAGEEDIVDGVDRGFEGRCLNIASAIAGCVRACHFEGNKSHERQLPNATPSYEFHSKQWNQIITVASNHRIPFAKTSGSFLLLVPLIAFCIRCIIGAFRNRNSRNQAADESGVHQSRSNSMRWKNVLGDLRDPNVVDDESEPDSDASPEDGVQLQFEEISDAYTKLEGDYQQFLSECGMSNSGYWRGGSPQ